MFARTAVGIFVGFYQSPTDEVFSHQQRFKTRIIARDSRIWLACEKSIPYRERKKFGEVGHEQASIRMVSASMEDTPTHEGVSGAGADVEASADSEDPGLCVDAEADADADALVTGTASLEGRGCWH